jgi:hypothetical protein
MELGTHGIDIAGERFGKLEALRVVAKKPRGNVWLCLCECGELATRLGVKLRQDVKQGRSPSCKACQRPRAAAAREAAARAGLTERFVRLWMHQGELYTARSESQIRREIRRGIAEALDIDEPDEEAPPSLPLSSIGLAEAIDLLRPDSYAEPVGPRQPVPPSVGPRRRRVTFASSEEIDEAIRKARNEPPAPAQKRAQDAPVWPWWAAPAATAPTVQPASCSHFMVAIDAATAECRWCRLKVAYRPTAPT